MRSDENLSRGGHVGHGGIQAWSAGDLFPWTIYTIEHYAPLTRVVQGVVRDTDMAGRSLEERFLWGEIRLKHPSGVDLPIGSWMRGEDSAKAHEQAQVRAARSIRTFAVLDQMALILRYGRPDLTNEQVAERVADMAMADIAAAQKEAVDRAFQADDHAGVGMHDGVVYQKGQVLYPHAEGYDHQVNPPYVEPFTLNDDNDWVNRAGTWGCT